MRPASFILAFINKISLLLGHVSLPFSLLSISNALSLSVCLMHTL